MRLEGSFDQDLVPMTHVWAGPDHHRLKELPMLFDSGFNLSISITDETRKLLEIEDVSVETKQVKTSAGMKDFTFCLMYVKCEGREGYVDAIITHVDAVGMSFVEGLKTTLQVERGKTFSVE